MNVELTINGETCIRCGKCVRVCPSRIFLAAEDAHIELQHTENCIACGHCAAVCPTGAVRHELFPAEKVHAVDYALLPAPAQMELLCKARRSNRAFTGAPVPRGKLLQIVEAAHRAPTASNMQQVAFTVVTDPAKLRMISEHTIAAFSKVLGMLKNPLLKPVLKRVMPDIYKLIPQFERLRREHAAGNDLILRGAKAVILIHTPAKSRFGCEDANLAYQNGSLMAECLGVAHFYTGFVLSAIKQDKAGSLTRALGIEGRVHAGMALGMPAFRYPNYIDRKDLQTTGL